MSSTVPVDERKLPFDLYPPERRWPTIGALLIAFILHLGVVLVLPEEILRSPSSSGDDDTSLELTLVAPEPLTADQLRFVEVNPDAPKNEPDREDQYSFRSQQAASENVSDSPLQAPDVDGETDSQKIIQGSLEQAPPVPAGLYAPVAKQGKGEGTDGGQAGSRPQAAVAPAQPLPLPAFLQQEAIAEDGPGSRLEDPGKALEVAPTPDPNAPINIYKPQPEQLAVVSVQAGDGNGGGAEVKPLPRARPRLAPELIRGPLMQSRGSTRLRGSLAIDATFSEFGEYQQQFYAALQAGWYQEIEFFQPIDTATSVQVQFTIQSDGIVRDVTTVSSTASEIATIICESAIIKRSPYRPWTREMVQVFGRERTLTVSFHYR